jgi:hypothetical protein
MHGTITGKVVAASAEHRLQKARDEFWFFRTLIHPKMRRQRNSSNVSQTRNWTRKSPLTGSLLGSDSHLMMVPSDCRSRRKGISLK